MTKKQKALALLAALEACEGIFGGDVEGDMLALQSKVEQQIEIPEHFGDFLHEQQEALLELAVNPAIFGEI